MLGHTLVWIIVLVCLVTLTGACVVGVCWDFCLLWYEENLYSVRGVGEDEQPHLIMKRQWFVDDIRLQFDGWYTCNMKYILIWLWILHSQLWFKMNQPHTQLLHSIIKYFH